MADVKTYLLISYEMQHARTKQLFFTRSCGYLRRLHWSTLGQSKHSSGNGASCGRVFRSPEKCAHFAGDSKTFGYSVGFTLVIFMLFVVMSSFDMQCGQA